MDNKMIKAIIHFFHTRPDKRGVSRWYCQYTDTLKGKTLSFKIPNYTNLSPKDLGLEYNEFYSIRQEITIRDFNKDIKGLSCAGCNHEEIAKFIEKNLDFKDF